MAGCVSKATETAKLFGVLNFKTGQSLCNRFMHHEGLSLKHETSIYQKIPASFQKSMLNFQ
jgi:hypothetical protein